MWEHWALTDWALFKLWQAVPVSYRCRISSSVGEEGKLTAAFFVVLLLLLFGGGGCFFYFCVFLSFLAKGYRKVGGFFVLFFFFFWQCFSVIYRQEPSSMHYGQYHHLAAVLVFDASLLFGLSQTGGHSRYSGKHLCQATVQAGWQIQATNVCTHTLATHTQQFSLRCSIYGKSGNTRTNRQSGFIQQVFWLRR